MYLLDTNILIRIELKETGWENCRALLVKIDAGELECFLTDYSIDSIAIVLENHKLDPTRISKFLQSLTYLRGLKIYEVTLPDRVEACEHMKNYRLDYDDSIILQSMFSTGSGQLISFDPDFDKVKEIKRVEPKDIL